MELSQRRRRLWQGDSYHTYNVAYRRVPMGHKVQENNKPRSMARTRGSGVPSTARGLKWNSCPEARRKTRDIRGSTERETSQQVCPTRYHLRWVRMDSDIQQIRGWPRDRNEPTFFETPASSHPSTSARTEGPFFWTINSPTLFPCQISQTREKRPSEKSRDCLEDQTML